MDELVNLSPIAKKSLSIHEEKVTEEVLESACGELMEISGKEVKYKIDITKEDVSLVSKYIDSRMVDVFVDGEILMFTENLIDCVRSWRSEVPIPVNLTNLRESGDVLVDELDGKKIELTISKNDIEMLTKEEYEAICQKYNVAVCKVRTDKLEKVLDKEFLDEGKVKVFYKNSIYPEKNLEQIASIVEKINELTSGTEELDSEIEKFLTIYKRISENIVYDYQASDTIDKIKQGKELTYQENMKVAESQNLSGIVEQTTVCAGFSRILQYALENIGMEASYVTGKTETERDSYHAWNQVKIDDIWYNTDVTWDRDDIIRGNYPRNCLKSDEEFLNHVQDVHLDNVQPCANTKEDGLITEFFEIGSLPVEDRFYTADEFLQLLPELNEQSINGVRVAICKEKECEDYSVGIANVLTTEFVKWSDIRISMEKDEMVDFVKKFTDTYKITKKESIFYQTDEGLELAIAEQQLKKDLSRHGMSFKKMLVPKDYNRFKDTTVQTALAIRREDKFRNLIHKIKDKFSNVSDKIKSKFGNKKELKFQENCSSDTEKLKSWDLKNWEDSSMEESSTKNNIELSENIRETSEDER